MSSPSPRPPAAAGTSSSRRTPRRRPAPTARPCAASATSSESRKNATASWETIGSLIAAIARGSAGSSRSGPTRIWWWSVPNSAATRSENSNSSPSRSPTSSKPTENVASPCWPCSASSATIRLESSPPDSRIPTGHVGHHPPPHRHPQRVHDRALPVRRRPVRARRVALERRVPVAALAPPSVGLQHQQRRGRELAHAAQDRPRRGHDRVEGEVVVQRHRVDARVDPARPPRAPAARRPCAGRRRAAPADTAA